MLVAGASTRARVLGVVAGIRFAHERPDQGLLPLVGGVPCKVDR